MPKVQNNLDLSRYELYLEGQLAGFLKYRMENGQMWLLTTQMSAEHQDPVLVDNLLLWVLRDVRRRRIEVLPFCPTARQAMLENPQFLQLIPANPPGHFPLLMDAVELMYDRAAVTVSMRAGNTTRGGYPARVPPQAIIRSLRSRKKEQKRSERLRVQSAATSAIDPLPTAAVA